MAVDEDGAGLPWDREPREPGITMLLGGCLSIPLFLVVCCVAILALAVGLMVVVAMVENATEARLLDWLLSTTILLALFAVCVVPFRLWLGLRRRVRLARCLVQDDSMIADVTFLQSRPEGPGSIAFGSGYAELTGTTRVAEGGSYVARAAVAVAICLAFYAVSFLLYQVSPPRLKSLPFASLVIGVLAYERYRLRKDGPVCRSYPVAFKFSPEQVKSVQCVGPLLTIRFNRMQGTELRAVRFFVAPHFRERFFREFERVFPGYLPKAYRLALGREG